MRRGSGFLSATPVIVLAALISLSFTPKVARAGATIADPDISATIASQFPDRKTSSSDCTRFTAYVKTQLEAAGWTVEILPYSSLVKSSAEGSLNTTFLQVSGDNVLAYFKPPAADSPVDLLLVAPYDTFLAETGNPHDISYTCRATSALFTFAVNLTADDARNFPNLCVAFVSGHYQLGAGVGALIEEITEKREASVKSAIALGDIDALDSLPITVYDDTPACLLQAAFNSATVGGAKATVVGPRARTMWYRETMAPHNGVFSVESMLDNGGYPGEAHLLISSGIPAVITLGTPRNHLSMPLGQSSSGKVAQVAVTLRDLVLEKDPDALTGGLLFKDSVLTQVFGNLYLFDRKKLPLFGAALVLVSLVLIARHAGRRKDLTSLALLGGVALAMGFAHPMRFFWFSGDPERYFLTIRPYESLFVYVWSGLAVVALGTFRVYRVRARIAELHSRITNVNYAATPAATGEGASKGSFEPADAAEGPPAPGSTDTGANLAAAVEMRPPVGSSEPANWAGPWGLAVMAAVLVATTLTGSELAVPSLFSTAALALAVLLDSPDRLPKPVTIALRLLGAASILATVLWAGSPLSRDAARIYSISLGRWGTEAIAVTANLTVLVSCVVSTFRLPPPKLPRRMLWVTLAEIAILAALITVGMMIPRSGLTNLPARALMREFWGNDARLVFEATRALGVIELGVTETPFSELTLPPLTSNSKGLAGTVRFGSRGLPSEWATIAVNHENTVKGEESATTFGRVQAALIERPSYFQIVFRDLMQTRTLASPFVLDNPAEIAGVSLKESYLSIAPRPGYSITFTWWMPKEQSIDKGFRVTLLPVSSALEIIGKAVYLNRSYLGIRPAAPNAAFVQVTSVTGYRSYR